MSIESPCVRICCLDEDDICLGCFRSMQEIMQWGQVDDRRKQAIVDHARQRQIDYSEKHGLHQIRE